MEARGPTGGQRPLKPFPEGVHCGAPHGRSYIILEGRPSPAPATIAAHPPAPLVAPSLLRRTRPLSPPHRHPVAVRPPRPVAPAGALPYRSPTGLPRLSSPLVDPGPAAVSGDGTLPWRDG